VTNGLHWTFRPASSTHAFESEWDAFNARTLRTPLLNAAFLGTALQHFGNGDEQLAVAADETGTAAMCVLRMRGPAVVETFQPSQLPLCPWLQRDDLALRDVADSLVHHYPGPIVLVALTQLDSRLIARPADGPLLKTLQYIITGTIVLPESLEGYMAERSDNLLANLRRRQRNVEHEYGSISLEVLDEPGDVDAGISTYSRLESAGWKARVGTAIERGNPQWCFYVDAMKRFCEQGQGRMFVLRFGDQLAAAALAVVDDSIAYMLKTTHNERLRSFSPGAFLRREVIASVHREPPRVKRIEIYGPLNAAQQPWISETREMYHVNAYRTRTIAGLHSFSKRLRSAPAAHKGDATTRPPAKQPATLVQATTVERFDAIPRSARASLERDEAQEVFYSLEWFELLAAEVFAEGASPRLLHAAAKRGARSPQFLLPMVSIPSHPRWYGVRRLQSLANYYSSLYGPVAAGAGPDDLESLVFGVADILADAYPQWDVVDLHPLDMSSAFWELMQQALRRCGFWTDSYYCFGNWYLPVKVSTFDEYLAGRPSQLKSAFKSGSKRIFRDPSAHLTIVDRPGPDLERAIQDYELAYERSWKYSEPYPKFIPRLCELAARKGWLRLGTLRIGDRPAAAQVWLVKDGKASIYKVAYDEHFAKLSPGTVLTAALMKHVIEVDKVNEVDYLAGDDAY
jgi:CelD/BcsL family acetyltransferase involved in cellulose biosynthesis